MAKQGRAGGGKRRNWGAEAPEPAGKAIVGGKIRRITSLIDAYRRIIFFLKQSTMESQGRQHAIPPKWKSRLAPDGRAQVADFPLIRADFLREAGEACTQ
jgi:hypothetical protein